MAASAGVFLYVNNVDKVVKQAVKAGAQVSQEVADMFWGDRFGSITDPYGHTWSIATHVEDPTPDQSPNAPSTQWRPRARRIRGANSFAQLGRR